MIPWAAEDMRLAGPFTPMRFEATIEDCIVSQGEIPADLVGGLYRSGPTWKRPTRQGCNGWWTMDGMVQALTFRGDGTVDFKNRWIRTPKYLLEQEQGRGMFEWADGFEDWRSYGWGDVTRDEYNAGVPAGTNWVNAMPFGGEIIVSGEQGSPPMRIDPHTLETKGFVSWSPNLSGGLFTRSSYGDGAFTAHPKWDADTGELYGYTSGDVAPYVTLHWVRPDGSIRSRALDDAPYASNVHDMWLTKEYVVIPFQPLTIDQGRCATGGAVFGWEPDRPIVIGLIRRDNLDGEIVWITADIDPQYIMHTMSANQSGDIFELDAPIFERPPIPTDDRFKPDDPFYFPGDPSNVGRWTIDVAKRTVKSERLDDRAVEFPKVDERYYGKDYEHGFLLSGETFWNLNSVVKRNTRTGTEQTYKLIPDGGTPVGVFEPSFAPRFADAAEADGYLIVPICQFMENRSKFVFFDTSDIEQGPVATIDLPFQIGWTPHGHWMNYD